MVFDCAIIGAGPAGLSAALTLKNHGKNVIWFGSKTLSDKVRKAEMITNYPGLANVTGGQLAAAFTAQIEAAGLEITDRMATSVIPMGARYAVIAGPDFYETETVILAVGAAQTRTLPRENEFLGRGVSYCATCDGGLYRGKTVAVICGNPRFEHEVRYLAGLAAKVWFLPTYKTDVSLGENVTLLKKGVTGLLGEARVTGLTLSDGETLAADGLFCLRDAVAPGTLCAGLEMTNGHIGVDRAQKTSQPRIFAAGDCTGRPYQYAKAVGEGNVAAHGVLEALEK